MLYHLLTYLSHEISFFNVARYLTFRTIIALLSALFISFIFSPWFIRRLQAKQLGQVVRNDGPSSHFSKAGTPTMGGGLLLLAVTIPTLLWMDFTNPFLWYVLIIFCGYGILGFVDDYRKISKKNSKGVSSREKLFWQISLAFAVCLFHYWHDNHDGKVYLPFFKDYFIPLGFSYVLFGTFIVVGTCNAVNLTDGLDGLAIGPVMVAASCYAILSYVSGNHVISQYLKFEHVKGAGELAIFAAAMVGAGMGFLWYNTYPAQVFMGDVGSLPLGGAIGILAILSRHELLLAIIGGVFVLEAVSVISQVLSFKLTGKRIFRMAPIHHHFELKGWPEPKVIVRFWIISVVLALFGLLSLKIR